MGKGIEKKTDDERIMKKRMQYLEMASVVNTLLEKRYFPRVMKALEANKQGDFEKLCDEADIPAGVRNMLWEMLLKVWKATKDEAPWITAY
jgi:hypothetical protein